MILAMIQYCHEIVIVFDQSYDRLTQSSSRLSQRLVENVGKYNLQRSFPICSQAAMYWLSHLASSTAANGKATTLQRQLGHGYDSLLIALWSYFAQRLVVTAWVEAHYVLRAPPCAEELQRTGTVIRTLKRQMGATPMDISEVGHWRSYRVGWVPDDSGIDCGPRD